MEVCHEWLNDEYLIFYNMTEIKYHENIVLAIPNLANTSDNFVVTVCAVVELTGKTYNHFVVVSTNVKHILFLYGPKNHSVSIAFVAISTELILDFDFARIVQF